jgi:hypothetical protein
MSLSIAQTPESFFFIMTTFVTLTLLDKPKTVFWCSLAATMAPKMFCYDIMTMVDL